MALAARHMRLLGRGPARLCRCAAGKNRSEAKISRCSRQGKTAQIVLSSRYLQPDADQASQVDTGRRPRKATMPDRA